MRNSLMRRYAVGNNGLSVEWITRESVKMNLNCDCPIQPADDGSGVHPLHRENVWRSSVGPVLGQRDCLIVVKSRLLAKTLTCRVQALVASVQK